MSIFTDFLNLFKWNTVDDSEEEFDIDKALNDNWDKIDKKMEQHVHSTSLIHANVTKTKDGFMSKEDKQKIDNIENNAQANIIEKIKKNGTEIEIINKEINIELKKDDVDLGNVDNTSDLNKPISKLQKEEFDKKVDKEDGKVLSSNDFTNELKEKLEKETVPSGGTTGQVLTKKSDADNDVQWTDQTGQGGVTGDTVPIGSLMPLPTTIIPENWLLCDGSEVSRTEYSELFNVIGEDFGAGDGSSTFNLPNIKGRTIVGLDPNDEDFNEIGKTLGEKAHKLTVDELASHKHDINGNGYALHGAGSQEFAAGGANSTDIKTFLNIKNTGGDQPHNNIQPSFVGCYIIKAKQSAGLVATVVDNLESTSETDALSAKQGKVLNEKIETLTSQKVYSTEEKATGEVWIDGKLIYQKTIKITSLASNRVYSHGISNLGEVIDMSGSAYFTKQGWQPLQRIVIDAVAGYSLGIGDVTGSTFLMQVGSSYNGFTKAYVTIKYTKT